MRATKDKVLYLIRVVSKSYFEELCLDQRPLTSALGYAPDLEFPGVCASLVTERTLTEAAQTLYTGSHMLFLDARLLRDRTDYHLNISDQCGYLGIDTVYPWNINEFIASGSLPKAIQQCGDDFFGTEVVFHNPLPWSCVVDVQIKTTGITPIILPNKVLQATNVLDFRDTNCKPYFALPTPLNHPRNRCTKDEKEIARKEALLKQALKVLMQDYSSHELYFNRDLQNIAGFREILIVINGFD